MSFVVALALGLILTPLARWLALRLDVVDRPSSSSSPTSVDLKIHRTPIPVLGGTAALLSAVVAAWVTGDDFTPWVAGVAAAAAVVGVADDVAPLPPVVRVVGLIVAGIVLVVSGVSLPVGPMSAIVIVAVVVAGANAVNIVDGQDGLAGSLAALAALGIAGASFVLDAGSAGSIGLAVAGGLFAFLVWNRPPASIFLGNGGAYGVGAVIATLATLAADENGWHGVAAAAACVAVFAFELISTVVRRLASAAPMTQGDRDHAYDVLSRRLSSRERSTAVMVGVGATCALAGVVAALLPAAASWIPVAALAIAGSVAAVWLYGSEGHE